jgi:hypothetical protein
MAKFMVFDGKTPLSELLVLDLVNTTYIKDGVTKETVKIDTGTALIGTYKDKETGAQMWTIEPKKAIAKPKQARKSAR